MTAGNPEFLFSVGLIDDSALFAALFSAGALTETFVSDFATTTGKGTDRLNGFQFSRRANQEFAVASAKCASSQYRFAPYLENLKTKGRNKAPRLIGIPTVRDRVVLHQLNRFLAAIFPDRVPKNVASTYVRAIAMDLKLRSPTDTWVCGTDIKTFYDSIQQDRLLKVLGRRIKCSEALRLVERALITPTVPKNTRKKYHNDFRPKKGVPQGLSISNILAAIYMQEVDDAMQSMEITYFRYVDDVLMYGSSEAVHSAYRSLRARSSRRGLSLHPLSSGKSHIGPLSDSFGYLGYIFRWPVITVRESTIERFLQSVAAKFSDYTHNKTRRLDRRKYLTEDRLAEIFLLELNERITGAISEKKRYGWIAYFNQITDLSLLHRLDRAIAVMFDRLADFGHKSPIGLRKLSRAYYEIKFNPSGGYIRNYDVITTRAEKLELLEVRGRVGPEEHLTDEQINDRYDAYLRRVLSEMHADEGVLYG
ncbi:reverse transcriptase domain-containing protein [Sulfuritalea sp.]|uniref:reverse transcriptase domain-containing protein n=1 Tax=Sulfuritalea sp. TaxID=2480090 RepID=UPI00286DF1C3|nr:reverse transcriptase domain-containing protein [Sulfuritalea sp.]